MSDHPPTVVTYYCPSCGEGPGGFTYTPHALCSVIKRVPRWSGWPLRFHLFRSERAS